MLVPAHLAAERVVNALAKVQAYTHLHVLEQVLVPAEVATVLDQSRAQVVELTVDLLHRVVGLLVVVAG